MNEASERQHLHLPHRCPGHRGRKPLPDAQLLQNANLPSPLPYRKTGNSPAPSGKAKGPHPYATRDDSPTSLHGPPHSQIPARPPQFGVPENTQARRFSVYLTATPRSPGSRPEPESGHEKRPDNSQTVVATYFPNDRFLGSSGNPFCPVGTGQFETVLGRIPARNPRNSTRRRTSQ